METFNARVKVEANETNVKAMFFEGFISYRLSATGGLHNFVESNVITGAVTF